MTNAVKILGLDPGLRRTGWGVVVSDGARLSWVAHGVIAPNDKAPFAERLLAVMDGVSALIETHRPDECAIEEIFVSVNASSTLKLGHARAAAMLAPAKAGLTVAEYAAREVKKAVVGTGAADKDQIAFMVARLLPASGGVTADAADALAVALTHATARRFNLLPRATGEVARSGGGGVVKVADASRPLHPFGVPLPRVRGRRAS